ncbi:MAG: transcriptional regulator [Gemmatimonadetes bacterium]|nr:MAG: transcriptional regulator [Gemmatimonadota bacterium]
MSRRALLRAATKLARPPKGVSVQPHSLPSELAHVALWFHALSDVTRLNIVQMLSYQERCVGELEQVLDVPQPLLSFHLKVLKDAGLVCRRRDGQWVYYALQADGLNFIIAFIETVQPGRHAGCALDCCRALRALAPMS